MMWLMLFIPFLVTVVSAAVLIKLAPTLQLLAVPGEHRQHAYATPMVGGIAMMLGLFSGFLVFNEPATGLLIFLVMICVVGVVDDRYALPSWSRFLAQGVASYGLIQLTGVQLNSLGILFSTQELVLGPWATPVTIFATIGVINALNMSDGLDGLAGSMAATVLLAILISGSSDVSLILVALSSIVGFLVWNLRVARSQAKIFMGDAGSTMLGLLIAYLLISYSQAPTGITPVTALWLLAIPLVDAVAVLIARPLLGRSPFSADRMHYHHQLQDIGCSVNKTLIIAVVLQAFMAGVGIVLWKNEVNENLQLSVFLGLFTTYLVYLYRSSVNKT